MRDHDRVTVPSTEPCPEIQVVEADVLGTDLVALVVRCLATTHLGARFHRLDRQGRSVELTVTEIRRYPQVPVTEVDPPHAARLLLAGTGAGGLGLAAWDVLRGVHPVVT